MISYPVIFNAFASAESGIDRTWNFSGENYKIGCAVPAEFEGPGGELSPEDLFAQALTNCFIATFKVFAEKSKFDFEKVEVKSELIVDMDENKKPMMKSCALNVKITGCATPERGKLIAEKTFKSGFILNSVKTQLKLNLTFNP